MKNINEFITEGKDEKFFNSIKNILEKDKAAKLVLSRTTNYDANKKAYDQVPKILVKDSEKTYAWYTLEMVDEEMDFAAPKDMLGIFINRMFYPITDKEILMEIVKKYNEE
jgi:hypothetical protein